MDHQLLLKALDAAQKGHKYAFATVIHTTLKGTPQKSGAKMVVLDDGTIFGTIGGGRNEKKAQKECLKAIRTEKPIDVTYDYFGQKGQSVCGGQMQVFIEPVISPFKLVICGGGHIGLPLAVQGKMAGFEVTVIDNRKDFASKQRFPFVDHVIHKNYISGLNEADIDTKTAVMVVTQGNEHDFKCLKKCLSLGPGYLGVISSLAKKVKFFKRLKTMGFTDKDLKTIHIPAGIDIGAMSPAEIAVSIMAEIVSSKNKQLTGSAKFRHKS